MVSVLSNFGAVLFQCCGVVAVQLQCDAVSLRCGAVLVRCSFSPVRSQCGAVLVQF